MQQGNIILFPCPVSVGHIDSLSKECIIHLHQTTHFIVERAKTSRHFLKASNHPLPISQLIIHEITDNKVENENFLKLVLQGINIGVISEAGCPGIADPGTEMVDWGHKHGITIIPLVGPSSILLAMMASGLNGQNFAFNGYLSNKKPELIVQLKNLESKLQKTGQSQIFMETPYRNTFILEVIFQTLRDDIKLCIACDINGPTEWIKQKKISSWKKEVFNLHKRPCIFILG
jgi:16S rRNA (cytidine1402-2'-O)-methyltransferase